MDQDTLSRPELSPTGKTSIDANVDSDIQIVLTNEENTTNRSIQNVYCLNNLEWYRIGVCSNVNLCHRKEIVEEEIGKNSYIMQCFSTFSFLMHILIIFRKLSIR